MGDSALISDTEEFPMYTFIKIAYDTSIFFFGFLAVISPIVGLLYVGIGGAFFGIGAYFGILLLSLLKEILTMSLGIIKRLESIDKNTKK